MKHVRKISAVIYGYNDIVEKTVKTKLKVLSDNLVIKSDEDVGRRLCELLLNLSVPLPVVVLLEDNELRAVIVGTPSDNLWEQILKELALPGRIFLAFSVREELLSWSCNLCSPRGHLVEGLRSLSEEEIEKLRKILGS